MRISTSTISNLATGSMGNAYKTYMDVINKIASNKNFTKVSENVVDSTIKEFGRIDVLINNAQASASGVPIQDHTTEQFNLAMYSGLYATFYYMKACYPYLKETKTT